MFIIFLLIFCGVASADINVVYNPSTKEVYSLSDQSDAVIPNGYAVDTIKGESKEYLLQADAKDYKFNGKRLTLDAKKVNDREKADQEIIERRKEIESVQKKANLIAYQAMVSDGVTFKYIDEKTFK